MSFLGNILWLIFGGFLAGCGYILGGLVLCLTIVGIPFGVAAIRIGFATFAPFGKTIVEGPNANSPLRVIVRAVPAVSLDGKLDGKPFDLVISRHVLERTRHPARAARNIERLLRPGGVAFISTAWSQAFHATPDDYWRFSLSGLRLLFGRMEVARAFYCGGDVGLDVAYRVERDGKPELDPRAGAVEQGLFQLVLDHEDNKAVLARQATERLPVSRTYLPTLFVNMVACKS